MSTDHMSFFGLTPIPTVLLDASLRILQTSASFLSLYNITAEECSRGTGIYDLIDSKLLVPASVSVRSSIEVALARKNAYTLGGIVETAKSPNPTIAPRDWSLRAVPVFNGETLLYVSLEFQNTTHDPTKQTAVDSRLNFIHQEASRARSQFLAELCSEIRTRVDGMLAFLPSLLDATTKLSQREISGRMFEESGYFLLGLINDVLDCYCPSSGTTVSAEPAIICVEDILTSVTREFKPYLQFGVLDLSLDPTLPRLPIVYCDYRRYRQIIRNFVSNAVKFTEVGSIRIRPSVVEEDSTSCTIRAEVIDTGIGVSDSLAPYLFAPLATGIRLPTTPEYRVRGFGLSITRALAESMGGSVGFYPNPDPETHGSVFWASIKMTIVPLAKIPVAEGEGEEVGMSLVSALTTTSAPDPHKILREEIAPSKRLLLAEDNPVNQKLLTKFLKGLGFETVDAALDGAQAVQLCAKQPIPYDLILMDISMPGLDGIAATKEIRKAGLLHVPIIALAATRVKRDIEHLMQGMNDCISKPVRRDNLAEVLLKWLK